MLGSLWMWLIVVVDFVVGFVAEPEGFDGVAVVFPVGASVLCSYFFGDE